MKTPREILLARHKSIEPKLDELRKSAVAAVYDRRLSQRHAFAPTILLTVWRELILPCRYIWTGLAAVWLLILTANISMQDHSQLAMAKSPPSLEMILSFRQQQQLLSELIGPSDPSVAEPQKPYSPRPSSKRPFEIVTV